MSFIYPFQQPFHQYVKPWLKPVSQHSVFKSLQSMESLNYFGEIYAFFMFSTTGMRARYQTQWSGGLDAEMNTLKHYLATLDQCQTNQENLNAFFFCVKQSLSLSQGLEPAMPAIPQAIRHFFAHLTGMGDCSIHASLAISAFVRPSLIAGSMLSRIRAIARRDFPEHITHWKTFWSSQLPKQQHFFKTDPVQHLFEQCGDEKAHWDHAIQGAIQGLNAYWQFLDELEQDIRERF